jgi:hypothetical protein
MESPFKSLVRFFLQITLALLPTRADPPTIFTLQSQNKKRFPPLTQGGQFREIRGVSFDENRQTAHHPKPQAEKIQRAM